MLFDMTCTLCSFDHLCLNSAEQLTNSADQENFDRDQYHLIKLNKSIN